MYLTSSSVPHVAWNILGIAFKYAVAKGAHRRKSTAQKPSKDEELTKRAFWCAVDAHLFQLFANHLSQVSNFPRSPVKCFQWQTVYHSGWRVRRLAISWLVTEHFASFDLDYPIECDDEYWETENPEHAFKQPPGKPCTITSFVYMLKLLVIMTFAYRTLYSTKKTKQLSGLIDEGWEQRIVAQLDSSMNQWKDSLPDFRKSLMFYPTQARTHGTQYAGIQREQIFSSFTKRCTCTLPTLLFKSKYIGPFWRKNLRYHLLPWQFVRMQRDHALMFWKWGWLEA